MKLKLKRYLIPFMVILLLLFVTSCGKDERQKNENKYKIYYVNHDATGLLSNEYVTETVNTDEVVKELISRLGIVPEMLEYQAPLAGNFVLLNYSIAEGQLTLNFNENYRKQEITTEILVRAAIVRTLIQVKDIQYISFSVQSEPLTDASGNVVGVMNKDSFIDNAGNEINTYEKVKLRLYFANEEGDGLVALTRNKVYNSNISMERLIVEELIAGPREDDTGLGKSHASYPIMSPDIKIVSVSIKDGTCYVNLSEEFLTQVYNVTPEVTIYSIANSLVELANVNKVQILINGETNISYRENINLSTIFERDLDLVESAN